MNFDPWVVLLLSLHICIICILLYKKFDNRFYLISIVLLGLFLLIFPQIVTPYVVGIDPHWERVVAEITMVGGTWSPDLEGNTANAAASISVLVPMLAQVTGLSIDLLLKFAYILPLLIAIPFIWRINERIIGLSSPGNYLSILMLTGTASFFSLTVYSRQEICYFLMILLTYILLFWDMHRQSNRIVMIGLTVGLVITHYSTALIFIGINVIVTIFMWVRWKRTENLSFSVLGAIFCVFWVLYLVSSTLMGATRGAANTVDSIANLAFDKTSNIVQQQLNPESLNAVLTFNYWLNLAIIFLLVAGTVAFFFRNNYQARYIKGKVLFSSLSLVALGLIFASVLPGFSLVYNPERIYATVLFLFSGLIIVGLISVLKLIDRTLSLRGLSGRQHFAKYCLGIAAFIAISHLLLQTGVLSFVLYQDTDSKYFGDTAEDFHYTQDPELVGMDWYKQNNIPGSILLTDFYSRGYLPLQSYAGVDPESLRIISGPESIHKLNGAYFYTQKYDLALNSKLYEQDREKIVGIKTNLNNQNQLICNEGSAQVYFIA